MASIHFCEKCHNLTYLSMKQDDQTLYLVHHCRSCQHEEPFQSDDDTIDSSGAGACVFSMSFEEYDKSALINHNPYISHDVTLPQIKGNPNLICPNSECICHKGEAESSVKYIKYNVDNMEYLYVCDHCGMKWKNRS